MHCSVFNLPPPCASFWASSPTISDLWDFSLLCSLLYLLPWGPALHNSFRDRSNPAILFCLSKFTAPPQYAHIVTCCWRCPCPSVWLQPATLCATSVDKSDSHSPKLHFKLISIEDSLEAVCEWRLWEESAPQALNQNYSNDSDQRKWAPDRN